METCPPRPRHSVAYSSASLPRCHGSNASQGQNGGTQSHLLRSHAAHHLRGHPHHLRVHHSARSLAASRQGLCSPGRLRGRGGGSGGGWAHNAPDARAADCCAVQSCPKAGHSAVTCPERGAEAWLLAGLSVGVRRSLGCCDRGWMRLGPREQTSTRLTGHRPELQNVMSASKSHRAPIPTRIFSPSSTVWLVCKRMSTGAC